MINKCYCIAIFLSILSAILLYSCNASDPVLLDIKLKNGCVLRLRSFHDWEMSVPIYFDINCKEKNKLTLKSGPFSYLQPENIKEQVSGLSVSSFKSYVIVQSRSNDDVVLAFANLKSGFVYPPAGQVGGQYYQQREKNILGLKTLLDNPRLTLQK